MHVVATKRTPVKSEWVDVCYGTDGLDILLNESDFVVVIVPLTPDTTCMIGKSSCTR